VGYRAFAVRAAGRVGVAGWTRNLADGRVEVQATGTVRQLEEFEEWLRRGPRFAEVQDVEIQEIEIREAETQETETHETGATDRALSDARIFVIRS
jgi:acylphosphatase